MQPDEAFAMLLAFLVLTLPFGLYGFLRFLRYRETLFLAERGLLRPEEPAGRKQGNLRWGIILAALGVALSCGLYPIGWMVDQGFLGFGPWMLPGFVMLALGLGFILIHRLTAAADDGSTASAASGAIGGAGRPVAAVARPGAALIDAPAQQPMRSDAGELEAGSDGDESGAAVEG